LTRIIKENKAFFFCMGLYVLTGLFILILVPKGNLERGVNTYNTPWLDNFFLIVTEFGNGAFLLLIVFLLFMKRMYYGILSLTCFLASTLVVQSIKRFAFPEAPRPISFFEPTIDLHYISSLEIHRHFSFPSGHTSGAFTIFCLLAIIFKNKYLAVIFFLLAFMVGLSRIYLLQHFFADTYFGAVFGTAITMMCYYFIQYRTNLHESVRLNRSVFEIFKNSK
jgi:membrane-associated phospholipid phosphatase